MPSIAIRIPSLIFCWRVTVSAVVLSMSSSEDLPGRVSSLDTDGAFGIISEVVSVSIEICSSSSDHGTIFSISDLAVSSGSFGFGFVRFFDFRCFSCFEVA